MLPKAIVQRAAVEVLNTIYETDFLGFSYGFRPGRSQHQALDALYTGLLTKKVNWVLDLDIRGFFDALSHEWLVKFVEHRIADRRVVRLIQKWLNAGVLEDGKRTRTEEGTPQGGSATPLTQKVILTVWGLRSSVLGRTRRNRNAVTNGDGIFAEQNVFNQESHDSLAFDDTKRFGSAAQASKECCEGFCQAQECSAIVGLVGDRLQLSTECLLALAQHRHALPQLLDRQQFFLIGVKKSFNTFANMRQLPLQTLLTFSGWIRGARCYQPTIKFLLYQRRLFQQADHLSPDDLIEELLSDEAAVVANRAAEFPPAIGANALVVVNLTCAGLCRCSREGVATLRTADQPLDDTGRDGTPARSYLVLLEQLLGTGEALFRHQGRHGDLDPLFARAFVACCGAGRSYTPPTLWAHNPRPCRDAGLAEAGGTAIRGVAQHRPNRRAFPARACLASRDAFSIDPPGDLPDATPLDCVHLIDAPHYSGLAFIDDVSGGRLVGLANVTISIRSVAQHAHFARLCPVSLAAARALQDLRFVHIQRSCLGTEPGVDLPRCRLVATSRTPSRLRGERIPRSAESGTRTCAQAVWRIREHNLDLPFSGKVPHALQARTLQRRSAIAFIFADPLFGYFQIVALGELDQRRRLACNRVLLALLLGRNPCVDRRHPHHRTPLHARRWGAPEWAPKCRRLARALTRASDQTNRKREFAVGRLLGAAQPCFFRAPRNAFNAPVTIAPMVRPLLLAYFRSRSTVLGGSFNVIGTVGSVTSTGRSSWDASSKYRYA